MLAYLLMDMSREDDRDHFNRYVAVLPGTFRNLRPQMITHLALPVQLVAFRQASGSQDSEEM